MKFYVTGSAGTQTETYALNTGSGFVDQCHVVDNTFTTGYPGDYINAGGGAATTVQDTSFQAD
jgi:hypothetical protein